MPAVGWQDPSLSFTSEVADASIGLLGAHTAHTLTHIMKYILYRSFRPQEQLMLLPLPVDSLSDDDQLGLSSSSESEAGQASVGGCRCSKLSTFRDCFAEVDQAQVAEHRKTFQALHKLDQDAFIFDSLRQQSDTDDKGIIRYNFMGTPVCQETWRQIWQIGTSRFRRLKLAVSQGHRAAPVDLRFLKKKATGERAALRSAVFSFLQNLWETVGEVLPEDGPEAQDAVFEEDPAAGPPDAWVAQVVEVQVPGAPVHHHLALADTVRYLPPGTIYEYFRQFNSVEGERCSWRTFLCTWKENFSHRLRFRHKRQHAVCSTCVKYKLLVRNLNHDLLQRTHQLRLYQRHLDSQYSDRKVLWAHRSTSRRHEGEILIELDGVDQAKFAWPRSPKVTECKQFDGLPRPRLHCTGLIAHGHFRMIYISEADRKKNGAYTAHLLAAALTRLQKAGVPLEQMTLRVGMDNTSRENKNATVARTLMWLVGSRRVRSACWEFLVSGILMN